MIEFQNVTRAYARKVAVDGLTLAVPPGELFALWDPTAPARRPRSGCSPDCLRPTGGRCGCAGTTWSQDLRDATRSIGYVPEEPFLYEKLSGREFLEFTAEMRGLDRASSASGSPRVGVLRARRVPRRPDGNLLARHEAADGVRLRAVARSARAGGRRADGRAGSAERAGGQGPARAGPTREPSSSCPPTPWPWPRRSPTASASWTTAGCTFWERRASCSTSGPAPHLAGGPVPGTDQRGERTGTERGRREGRRNG